MIKGIASAVGATIVATAFAGYVSAAEQKATLTLNTAVAMVDACAAMASEMGWRMNIAVVDSGADLVAFRRQDGAFLGSIDVAIDKAKTSANFPFPTSFAAELAHGKDGQPGPLPGVANVPGIITFAGGLPIMAGDGVHVGGIGVSGASAEDDEKCAQAGIDAAASMLQ